MAPRNARVDLRSDVHLTDLQSLHTCTRCFAPSHHQLRNAHGHQALGNVRQDLLHAFTRLGLTKLGLHHFHLLGIGGGIHQHWSQRQMFLGPLQHGRGKLGHGGVVCPLQRVKLPSLLGVVLQEMRNLPLGGQRATAADDGFQAHGRGQLGTGRRGLYTPVGG